MHQHDGASARMQSRRPPAVQQGTGCGRDLYRLRAWQTDGKGADDHKTGPGSAVAAECLYVYNVNIVEQQEGVMSKSVTIAARVDADLDAELNRLATTTGRSKSWLVNEALRSFVANEQQFLAAVEEGKQALREGRVVDHATVVAAFERIVSPH